MGWRCEDACVVTSGAGVAGCEAGEGCFCSVLFAACTTSGWGLAVRTCRWKTGREPAAALRDAEKECEKTRERDCMNAWLVAVYVRTEEGTPRPADDVVRDVQARLPTHQSVCFVSHMLLAFEEASCKRRVAVCSMHGASGLVPRRRVPGQATLCRPRASGVCVGGGGGALRLSRCVDTLEERMQAGMAVDDAGVRRSCEFARGGCFVCAGCRAAWREDVLRAVQVGSALCLRRYSTVLYHACGCSHEQSRRRCWREIRCGHQHRATSRRRE